MIKVRKGTRGTTRLCDTCEHATIMKGSAESQEFIDCDYTRKNVPNIFPVVECNRYMKAGRSSLRDMKDVAWIIEPSKKEGGHWGFVRVADLLKKNPDATIIPDGVRWDL